MKKILSFIIILMTFVTNASQALPFPDEWDIHLVVDEMTDEPEFVFIYTMGINHIESTLNIIYRFDNDMMYIQIIDYNSFHPTPENTEVHVRFNKNEAIEWSKVHSVQYTENSIFLHGISEFLVLGITAEMLEDETDPVVLIRYSDTFSVKTVRFSLSGLNYAFNEFKNMIEIKK